MRAKVMFAIKPGSCYDSPESVPLHCSSSYHWRPVII